MLKENEQFAPNTEAEIGKSVRVQRTLNWLNCALAGTTASLIAVNIAERSFLPNTSPIQKGILAVVSIAGDAFVSKPNKVG